jgi:single-strand DNA-binding protein
MDRAQFEIIGNVGKLEFKQTKSGRLAVLSVATSERWKGEDNDWVEKTYWHRVTVFQSSKIARIEERVQRGSRVRLVGQIRPGSYNDPAGHTKYVVELVIGPFGECEVLARPKPNDAVVAGQTGPAGPAR